MTKYTATLPTGETITTNTYREPRTAWAIIDKDNKIVRHGFSADYYNATKTARSRMPSAMPVNYRSKDVQVVIDHSTKAQMKGWKSRKEWYAACERETQKLRKGLKVIFADAKIVVDF